jgi:KaiC/GvpD/RAD55 family RecA-like ATPase
MHSLDTIDYEKIGRENLKRALVLREYHRVLNERLRILEKDSVVIVETPAENYLEANISSIKTMLDNGYKGVYLSFQRPFKNIYNLFEKENINLNSLFIVDCATAFSRSDQEINPRCVNINPDVKVDEMVNIICDSLQNLDEGKRFVFIDSLSTLGLHESFSETLRFPELLINTMKKKNIEDVTFVFNIAKHLTGKRYVENLNVYANEYIHLGLCT